MRYHDFRTAISYAKNVLISEGRDVDAGSWQGYQTRGRPDLITQEILNLQLEVAVNRSHTALKGNMMSQLQSEIQPNLPWADDHFAERVGRLPTNPGVEYKNWPWWLGQDKSAMEEGGVFSHTYQERFWPRLAGESHAGTHRWGIRYLYGDLDSVVKQLTENPYTRQATFPIFFPEDTGAVGGIRTPCTLHYHFMCRNDQLHMWYAIRSCDYVRHFRDDLYLACKLMLWVLEELKENELRSDLPQLWVDVSPGTLFFTAYSFHVHKGDLHHVA